MNTCSAKHLKTVIMTSLIAAVAGCNGANTDSNFESVDTSAPPVSWQMIWNDEFEGTAIDSRKWEHEVNCSGGGNNEKQCYTDSPENSFISDGMLHIVAHKAEEGATLPYTSARLRTKYKGDWTYGRFEMRAKLPSGQGSWPAFWMLPTDEVYGGWPKSGEIDIVEAVNLKVEDDDGVAEAFVHGTLHYGKESPNNSNSGRAYALPDGVNPADDFHTYAVEWQQGEIRWYVDDYLYATQRQSDVAYNADGDPFTLKHRGWFAEYFDGVTGELETQWNSAPYDQDFHLLLNLAVGGDWPENVNDLGIDDSAFTNGQSYIVDYVRVYQCSTDPLTGKGCDTVRAGYDQLEDEANPSYALVEGKAPMPTPPSTGPASDLIIFDDAINPDWPAWDCCGGSTPAEVQDDAEHGTAIEFSIGAEPTVMGFVTKTGNGGGGTPYDASSILETGTITFEVKVESLPTVANAQWLFKIESNDTSSAVEMPLTSSVEGVAPPVGQWQQYTYNIKDLADAGLELSAIDVLMIFPAWGAGEGAVYRVDNVKINTGLTAPELVLFEDTQNAAWPAWDCCGGSTPVEQTDDADHGAVIEFSVGAEPTVMGFSTKSGNGGGDQPFDASSIFENGVVQFEMKVESMPTTADAAWLFKIESGDATTAVELPLSDSVEGAAPVTAQWQTYTFTLADLASAGLDLSAIDVLMVFPAWGAGEGAIYRLDNVKIFDPTAQNSAGGSLTLFADTAADQWSIWDCCGGSTPQEIQDEDGTKGTVAEFSIGATETVMGFLANDDVYFDASSLLSGGYIRFEMKVVSMPNDTSAPWLFKVESGDTTTDVELSLSDSVEGTAPEVGVWQTYTFMLQDLLSSGLDVSAIDVVMVFPAWGQGNGAVYRIDNAVIAAD
ncbi:glycoside hydrolase family 16 protein [Echinimonas agarilytica]|uniref:Family 16 glycosylhydrolase n=1 Tax=Echinimonas agarilytica TaxID=1215918 RepID=A0AA41W3Y1_9GAMM|nr:glycoside hydrolase family 16 protein [Echinimonas agarilytica]MCM2678375.1 family 16 glycosylhydrolase [Echinimonas agarilytica]